VLVRFSENLEDRRRFIGVVNQMCDKTRLIRT
jgi:hypothetical protein